MTLIGTLGGLVPDRFTLELTHAGAPLLGTLQALTGGRLEDREVAVAALDELRVGVPTKTARHLLTAFTLERRSVLVPTERLVELGGASVLERPGGIRRFLDSLGPEGWSRVGTTTDASLKEALPKAVAQLVDAPVDVQAAELAERLGGGEGTLHPLRFTLTDPTGGLVGGYTLVVG